MGNTDLVPVLASCSSEVLGRALLGIDKILETTPFFRKMAWASLFRAVKREVV